MLSDVVSSFAFLFDRPWKFWKQSRTFLAITNTPCTIIEPALSHSTNLACNGGIFTLYYLL